MCQVVYIDGKRFDTVGDLRSLFGSDGVSILPGYGHVRDDCCLCPVDLEAVASYAGRTLWHDNNMTATLTLPGQRFEYECTDCNLRISVAEIDEHFDACHRGKGGMSYSGPHLVGRVRCDPSARDAHGGGKGTGAAAVLARRTERAARRPRRR